MKISMIVPDAELMRHHRSTQFPDWNKMIERSRFQELLLKVQRRLKLDDEIDNYESFIAALEQEENQARVNLTKYAKMIAVKSLLPVNFWIADGEVAVLAIKSFEDDVFAYAFETRDVKLIEALIASWHYHAKSPEAKEI